MVSQTKENKKNKSDIGSRLKWNRFETYEVPSQFSSEYPVPDRVYRMKPSASIIIPAHNEEKVIKRTLRSILMHARPDEFDIIVVCNGCTDRTAAIARSMHVRVIETSIASKTHAMNIGDLNAYNFPRFYLDADVSVSAHSVREMIQRLKSGRMAVSARPRYNLTGCSRAVKAFYRIWLRHPNVRNGVVGSGLYALTKEARGRWRVFPKITADDEFVRRHFLSHECISVDNAVTEVQAPRTLKDLIRIKTRSRRGTKQLREQLPMLPANQKRSRLVFLARLLMRPQDWPYLPFYFYVVAASLVMATITMKKNTQQWERDESSRVASN